MSAGDRRRRREQAAQAAAQAAKLTAPVGCQCGARFAGQAALQLHRDDLGRGYPECLGPGARGQLVEVADADGPLWAERWRHPGAGRR